VTGLTCRRSRHRWLVGPAPVPLAKAASDLGAHVCHATDDQAGLRHLRPAGHAGLNAGEQLGDTEDGNDGRGEWDAIASAVTCVLVLLARQLPRVRRERLPRP
jgi:hypothetical protein